MKLLTVKNVHILLLALVFCGFYGVAFSQIYKVIDKDGNVSYTDTVPKDGSKPLDLPPLSVIETPEYQRPAKTEVDPEDKVNSLRTLRSRYKDFAITSPQQEESVWSQEQNVAIQWATGEPILDGMLVKVTVDGVEQTPTAANMIAVPPLERGEHQIGATLLAANGSVVASAASVTFFVKRPNVYTNPQHIRSNPQNN